MLVCFLALQPSAGYGLLRPRGFRDHTQRRAAVGRTPLNEWSARLRDLYLTAHNTHNNKKSMPPVGFFFNCPSFVRFVYFLFKCPFCVLSYCVLWIFPLKFETEVTALTGNGHALNLTRMVLCPCRWPRGLRRRPGAARLSELWVGIPPRVWKPSLVNFVFFS
jgi:hypothetical protein